MLSGRDFTVDDIVQHVIERTLSGERKWDPEKVALLPWLKFQVKSVMDAWIRRESGKHEISFATDVNEGDTSDEVESFSVKLDNTIDVGSPQPERALLEKEAALAHSEVINRLFQVMSKETELEDLFDAITETGSQKPSILAEYLKVEMRVRSV
jgi:DNA-directed RNA polymerase specialized sigma24 family protein